MDHICDSRQVRGELGRSVWRQGGGGGGGGLIDRLIAQGLLWPAWRKGGPRASRPVRAGHAEKIISFPPDRWKPDAHISAHRGSNVKWHVTSLAVTTVTLSKQTRTCFWFSPGFHLRVTFVRKLNSFFKVRRRVEVIAQLKTSSFRLHNLVPLSRQHPESMDGPPGMGCHCPLSLSMSLEDIAILHWSHRYVLFDAEKLQKLPGLRWPVLRYSDWLGMIIQ